MIIFNNLTNSLTKVFEKFGLNENIELNLSRIDGYDLQINNLVKHNKTDYFKELQNNIIEIMIFSWLLFLTTVLLQYFNLALHTNALISGSVDWFLYACSLGSTVIYCLIAVYITYIMFDDEKVIFRS